MLKFFQQITKPSEAPIVLQPDDIYVIFELSQSNGGQAEADRLILTDQITAAGLGNYNKTPPNCYMWGKEKMKRINNGKIELVSAGVNTSQYTNDRCFGAEISALPRFRDLTGNPSYYIKAMEGGTALAEQAGVDWNANSVDELLDTALLYFAEKGLEAIAALHPTKTIKPIIFRHQGESDDQPEEYNAYYQNSVDFLAKIRAYTIGGVQYFLDAPFVDVILDYSEAAPEAIVNDIKLQFASEQPNCYTIDMSNQPRKIDLTTAQKGGIAPTLTDNEHSSYLAQLQKGENLYTLIRQIGY